MKNFLIALISLLSSFAMNAQLHLEAETDPIAWAAGGGSFHLAASWQKQRLQLGYAFLPVPEGLATHPGLQESFQAIAFKWDYFVSKAGSQKGFFFGPTVDYLRYQYQNESGTTLQGTLNLGGRLGYKIDLFPQRKILSGLYLTPWVGLSYLFRPDEIEVGSQSYAFPHTQIFPTVHLGYRF